MKSLYLILATFIFTCSVFAQGKRVQGIYLYPTTKKSVKISLKFKGEMGNTYPVYDNGWKVSADSSGRLVNEKDNRKFNYLFWDGVGNFESKHFDYKSGFYINKFAYLSFLEEKLKLIGLKDQEMNDFIVYWLPIMNKYPFCFIHFWVNDNIDQTTFIETSPKTNSQIRLFMDFKGYTDITAAPPLIEQKLTTIKRKGFTLVEWGGSEIASKKTQ